MKTFIDYVKYYKKAQDVKRDITRYIVVKDGKGYMTCGRTGLRFNAEGQVDGLYSFNEMIENNDFVKVKDLPSGFDVVPRNIDELLSKDVSYIGLVPNMEIKPVDKAEISLQFDGCYWRVIEGLVEEGQAISSKYLGLCAGLPASKIKNAFVFSPACGELVIMAIGKGE